MNPFLPLVLIIVGAEAAHAQPVTVHGWIDAYYAWNQQHGQSHLNFFSGTGTSAHRAGEVALNAAAVDVVHDAQPVGFHLTLVAGDSTDVVHGGERHPRRRITRLVYQASASFFAPMRRGLTIEAGVYPSHIGLEGFFSKDNWSYTRGWLGEFSPYYQTGIKASYAWNDLWSGQLHILRGWQLVSDNNGATAVGTQLAYNAPRFSASFNTFVGPELPHDRKHLRTFGDLVATWKATPALSIAGSLDRGRQGYPGGARANWLGVAVFARYSLNDRHAVAFRTERFRDPDAGISGIAQTLTEATATYEMRPTQHEILKLEVRRDRSTAAAFNSSRSQTLAIASGVVFF